MLIEALLESPNLKKVDSNKFKISPVTDFDDLQTGE